MFSHELELRKRGIRIQITGHSPPGNLNNFGASSFLKRVQHRWLRLRNQAVAKSHLILWLLSCAVPKNRVQ